MNKSSVIPSKLGAFLFPIFYIAFLISLVWKKIGSLHLLSSISLLPLNYSFIHFPFISSIVVVSLISSTSFHSFSPYYAYCHYSIFTIGPLITFNSLEVYLYFENAWRLLCQLRGSSLILGSYIFSLKYWFADCIIAFLTFTWFQTSSSCSNFCRMISPFPGLTSIHLLLRSSLFLNAFIVSFRFYASTISCIINLVVCYSHFLFIIFSFIAFFSFVIISYGILTIRALWSETSSLNSIWYT